MANPNKDTDSLPTAIKTIICKAAAKRRRTVRVSNAS
jgi:hypothetical protein